MEDVVNTEVSAEVSNEYIQEDSAQNNENKTDNTDQAYLSRGEYSSELFKLEIKNLPKNFGFGVNSFAWNLH